MPFRHTQDSYRPWHLAVNVIAASALVTHERRHWIYRRAGLDVRTVDVRPGQRFLNERVQIGAGSMIGPRCSFASPAPVVIGERCWVAAETMFMTGGHEIGPHDQRAGPTIDAPVVVGDGCWIGTRAVILGVTIGAGCVIAAGSVVTRDCEADGLYAGAPAVRKRDLH